MHVMKLKYELRNKLHQNKTERDPFSVKKHMKPNPERLSHNTLDTFLLRIRTEILNESKYTQNKTDNLTRKERLALNELIHNDTIVISKADKGSTVVVEDRKDYINNATPK